MKEKAKEMLIGKCYEVKLSILITYLLDMIL